MGLVVQLFCCWGIVFRYDLSDLDAAGHAHYAGLKGYHAAFLTLIIAIFLSRISYPTERPNVRMANSTKKYQAIVIWTNVNDNF